ncbi:hypothetical protein [Burkholderia sp. WSM2230]|uniref:hypothetical protein n=1 Tax=Burkholderia sp. WSM2230 TaxID=944435 RepID=UPI0003FB1D5A|nr:hypothetical protein [Burkholderia sp. WSM2230]
MTRVGYHAPTASLAAQAQTTRERSQQSTVARFAVLYRGTISFSYARTQQMALRGSLLARRLAALNARKRNAARRAGMRRPLVASGNEASGHAPDGGDCGRITRDGGGGRGSGAPPHDGHDGADGDEGMSRAQIRARSGHTAVAPPAPGVLQKFVAAQGSSTDIPETLPRLWCDALLALRDEAAARPRAPLDAMLHECFIDLLAVQLQNGVCGDTSMGTWRQRLIDASGMRGAAAPGEASETRSAAGQADASAEEISRAGRLNLLMPLLLLSYARPSTPLMRERALNVRIVQRGMALTAAEHG